MLWPLVLFTSAVAGQSALDSYNRALNLYRSGDLDAAIQEVRTAIDHQPIFPEAYNMLGLLLGKKGHDPASVLRAFQKAVEQRQNFGEAHYHLGLLLSQLGQVDEGASELRKAISCDPDNADFYNALALAQMDRKIDESISLLEHAIRLRQPFVEAELNLALAYHRRYGTEKEIAQLKRVIEMEPSQITARNILTRRYEETGKFDEALAMALETEQKAPESAEARLFAGKGLMRRGDLTGAVDQLRSAMLADPSLLEAHHHLAVALRGLGREQEASKEFEQEEALRDQQHSSIAANIQMSQVRSKLDAGDTNGAISLLQQVIQTKPQWADARITLGRILLMNGDQTGATEQFASAVRLAPNDFDALYGMGYLKAGTDRIAAIDLLRRAIEVRPSSAEAHYNLGAAYFAEGRTAEAMEQFRTTLTLAPSFVSALTALGAALLALDRPAEAAAPLSNAIALNPEAVDAMRLLAAAEQKLGHGERYRELAERAEELHAKQTGRAEAAQDLTKGTEKLSKGNRPGALENFRDAVRKAPDLAEAHQFLGAALLDTDVRDAEEELTRALSLRPDYFGALYNRGLARARMQRFDEAILDLSNAARIKPNESQCHDSLGAAYGMKGDYPKAIAEFREAVRLKPEWALAQYHLASALRLAGDAEGAKAAYAQAQQLDPRLKSPTVQ